MKPKSYYTEQLKLSFPTYVFLPNKKKIIPILVYSVLYVLSLIAFTQMHKWSYMILLGIFQGHTMACLAFLAHDMSHGSIVKSPIIRYILELYLWGINLVPPTLWSRVHNQLHHAYFQTTLDPDRDYKIEEKTVANQIYSKMFYPQKKYFKWNPLILFHFIPYIIRNMICAFLPDNKSISILPSKYKVSQQQKKKIAIELLIILFIQIALFLIADMQFGKFIFISIIPVLITSSIVMVYIFTNHWINPIEDIADPLANTVSVVVPQIFNVLHSNFSYHTEHHLYPGVSSDHYPLISEVIQNEFGEQYNRIPIADAWKAILSNEKLRR